MKNKLLFVFSLLTFSVSAQPDRFTKDLENGYTWIRMEDPIQFYSISKEIYLSSILERIRLTQEKHSEISALGCKEDINFLSSNEDLNEISLADMVSEIDRFYLDENNMVIPIIFSYCYSIKKLAGLGRKELNDYRKAVLLFCEE